MKIFNKDCIGKQVFLNGVELEGKDFLVVVDYDNETEYFQLMFWNTKQTMFVKEKLVEYKYSEPLFKEVKENIIGE